MASNLNQQPLLPVRTALVLLLTVLAGIGACVLTYLSGQNAPASLLAGGAAAGGALVLFHNIVG